MKIYSLLMIIFVSLSTQQNLQASNADETTTPLPKRSIHDGTKFFLGSAADTFNHFKKGDCYGQDVYEPDSDDETPNRWNTFAKSITKPEDAQLLLNVENRKTWNFIPETHEYLQAMVDKDEQDRADTNKQQFKGIKKEIRALAMAITAHEEQRKVLALDIPNTHHQQRTELLQQYLKAFAELEKQQTAEIEYTNRTMQSNRNQEAEQLQSTINQLAAFKKAHNKKFSKKELQINKGVLIPENSIPNINEDTYLKSVATILQNQVKK